MIDSNTNKPSEGFTTVHGVLVKIQGTGVLIVGDAGIGKSECALELISRGHRFVADDSVEIRIEKSQAEGRAPELTRGFLYVRGLGAFQVTDVFGQESLLLRCSVDLVLELSRNSDADVGFRLGPNFQTETILGTDFAKLTIPVRSGRNLAVLVETAVKIYELWRQGRDASRDLAATLSLSLSRK